MNETSSRLLDKMAQECSLAYFRGEPITDMSKEQLIKLVNWLTEELDRVREQHMQDLDTLLGFRK